MLRTTRITTAAALASSPDPKKEADFDTHAAQRSYKQKLHLSLRSYLMLPIQSQGVLPQGNLAQPRCAFYYSASAFCRSLQMLPRHIVLLLWRFSPPELST